MQKLRKKFPDKIGMFHQELFIEEAKKYDIILDVDEVGEHWYILLRGEVTKMLPKGR